MIDGVHALNNIFIIAMTNRKDLLDEALLRPGRIELHIEIGLPNLEGRKEILRIHTQKMKNSNFLSGDVDINKLADLTENFTGAELESLVKNAVSRALQEQLTSTKKELQESDICVTMTHFLSALEDISPMFGKGLKQLSSLLPREYLHLRGQQNCLQEIETFLKRPKALKTILVTSETGNGKTTLVTKLALDKKMKYTKVLRMIDLVNSDEIGKINSLVDIFSAAYLSDESLIVLDDLEILINYAKMGLQTTFSNRLYQTLITLLKTGPPRDHRLTIVATCTDDEFTEMVKRYFDRVYELEKISSEEVSTILRLKDDTINDTLTVRELLDYV